MATFPRLKSGAIMQYPGGRSVRFATRIVRFLDGTEQRYRERGTGARRWLIRFRLLDEDELAALESFFLSSQGQAGSFDFYDPWDDVTYHECTFEQPELILNWIEQGRGEVEITVSHAGGS